MTTTATLAAHAASDPLALLALCDRLEEQGTPHPWLREAATAPVPELVEALAADARVSAEDGDGDELAPVECRALLRRLRDDWSDGNGHDWMALAERCLDRAQAAGARCLAVTYPNHDRGSYGYIQEGGSNYRLARPGTRFSGREGVVGVAARRHEDSGPTHTGWHRPSHWLTVDQAREALYRNWWESDGAAEDVTPTLIDRIILSVDELPGLAEHYPALCQD